MKNYLLLLIPLLFFASCCEDKTDVEKEKAAVMAVIEEETAAYYAADIDRWAATYLGDSTNLSTSSNNYVYSLVSGWHEIYSNAKNWFPKESLENKEVKTPLMVKVYDESAWIIYDNQTPGGEALVSCFLEEKDDSWKIVYRGVINTSSYLNGDIFIINSISFAKNMGNTVELFAAYTGDQMKAGWSQETSLANLVYNVRSYWGGIVKNENIQILEQDENHAVIECKKMLLNLKNNGPVFGVTYDDYLTFIEILYQRIADHVGLVYTQETISNGVKITISKK